MPRAYFPALWTSWCHHMFERDLPKREGESREKEERRGEVKGGGVGGRLEERQAGGIDRDQGEEKSNKKPRDRQQREQRGGERGRKTLGISREGRGKKLDTANLAVTFFPSFLSLWKKTQEKKKARGQKLGWITFVCICIALQDSQAGPWIYTRTTAD